MPKIELLNNITHETLKVDSKFSADLGDNVVSTVTFLTEFSDIQKEYPILCRKNPETDTYQAIAFFGFTKDENLFLVQPDPKNQVNVGWRAEYVPSVIARGPFSIGIQRDIENGSEVHKPVIHVDMNHPKITNGNGEKLFLDSGGHSPYLNHISQVLDTLNEGMYLTKLMFDAFVKYQLLEDVSINIEFCNQQKLKFNGFQTINIEKLSALDGDILEELNKSGFLQAAYFIVASMANMKKLINWKNRQLLAGEVS